jgi:RNA polymerase sigma factor (sigma-70 family)
MDRTDDEPALLARARSGDGRAFQRLIAPHRDMLWSVCFRITRSHQDADDALQDCLLSAWRNLDGFRGSARLSTWLFRIASNSAAAIVRRRRETPADLPETSSRRSDIGDELADRDRVRTALRGLPEDFRIALVLREYGGLSYDEIAAHQGILVQTVKTRLNRARSAMRSSLEVSPNGARFHG